MQFALKGTPPRGAVATSGTISATTAITAGHIAINSVSFPAVPVAANAAERCAYLVDLINSYTTLTGVMAERVTTTTYKLHAGREISATLGATATVATFGFVTSIYQEAASRPVSETQRAFGSNGDEALDSVMRYGNSWIDLKSLVNMGVVGINQNGDAYDVAPPASATRTNN